MMRGKYDFSVALGALALGFLLPFWPLILAGVGGLVVSGYPISALSAAFLFDLLFGAGTGLFSFAFPMTTGAIFAVLLSLTVKKYVRS